MYIFDQTHCIFTAEIYTCCAIFSLTFTFYNFPKTIFLVDITCTVQCRKI